MNKAKAFGYESNSESLRAAKNSQFEADSIIDAIIEEVERRIPQQEVCSFTRNQALAIARYAATTALIAEAGGIIVREAALLAEHQPVFSGGPEHQLAPKAIFDSEGEE